MLATAVIQPIDTVKVRIQLESEAQALGGARKSISPFTIARNILEAEGTRGLYKG